MMVFAVWRDAYFAFFTSSHTLSINTALESPKTVKSANPPLSLLSSHLHKVNTDPPTSRLHFWMASKLVKMNCHVFVCVCLYCSIIHYICTGSVSDWMKIALLTCCTITLEWIEIWATNKALFHSPCSSDLA